MNMLALTSKVDINLGYACNLRCPFCYYYDSVVSGENLNTLSTDEAKAQLRRARRLGIREIEFTGGEVTLRKDLSELIRYCKQELKFDLVSMITNGVVFSNQSYAKKLAEAGLDDVLFSLHGANAATHDELTATPRSFERILVAMENADRLGLRVRTNSVICQSNYENVYDILRLCIDKRVDNINLVMFNPIIQATELPAIEHLYVRYADVGREMVKAFDRLEGALPHTNVRYMPFCFLPGYEHMITNHDQFNFEADEWNNFAKVCIEDGVIRATKRALFALRDVHYKRFALRHGIKGLLMAGMGRHFTKHQKIKSPKCEDCAYSRVCDYVWKGYHDVYGDDVMPIPGKKIDNPVHVTAAASLRAPGVLPPKAGPANGPHSV